MRIFVAVPLPQEIKREVASLGSEISIEGVALVRPENMHLTLKFIGEIQPPILEGIKQKLEKIKFAPFKCSVKGVGVFPNPEFVRVVWAGVESGGSLEALAKEVIETLEGYGRKENFTAHLTIARVKKRIDLSPFLKKYKDAQFGSFEIAEFHLMQSELGRSESPKYTVLSSFRARI